MMLRLLCSSILLLLALKKMSVSAASCSACGAGFEISLPDVVVTTNNGTFTCAQIQTAAAGGFIPESQCAFIPVFIFTDCGCVNSTGVSTTPAPVAPSPTKAPVAPTKKPISPTKKPTTTAPVASPTSASSAPAAASTNSSTCAICADGETISIPDAEVTDPSTGTFTCSQIDEFAAGGVIPAEKCSSLSALRTTCGCTGGSGSGNTTTTAPVASTKTSAPSAASTTTAPAPAPISSTPSPASAAPAAATPTASASNSSACAICPSGQSITKLDVSVDTPQGTFTCSQIDEFASGGIIPGEQCAQLSMLVSICGCSGGSTPTAPLSPTKPSSPVAPTPVASNSTSSPASAPPAAATPTASASNSSACAICPSGQSITKPDVSVDSPQGTFTCAQIDEFASGGMIQGEQCAQLPQLATTCGCSGGSTPTAASSPSKPSSPVAPIAPSSTPVAAAPTAPTCTICTASQVLSKPDVTVTVPNVGPLTCAQIEAYAKGGQVPKGNCAELPKLATQCGCVAGSPSAPTASTPTAPSPVTSESPTLAGTYPPTPEVTYKKSTTSAATATTTWSRFGMMLMTMGAMVSLSAVAVV